MVYGIPTPILEIFFILLGDTPIDFKYSYIFYSVSQSPMTYFLDLFALLFNGLLRSLPALAKTFAIDLSLNLAANNLADEYRMI